MKSLWRRQEREDNTSNKSESLGQETHLTEGQEMLGKRMQKQQHMYGIKYTCVKKSKYVISCS